MEITTRSIRTYQRIVDRYGEFLTPKEAAEYLGCHPSHMRAMCQDGRIQAVRIGSRWRISAAKLAAMLEGGDAHVDA